MISVIIPTYNGANKVLNVLRALEQQTYKDFETIVVIDGSTDNTIEVLSEAKLSLAPLKIILQENKGRAAVRNRGAQEANGDLLIFFDDDMRPTEDCILAHVNHHKQIDNSICVGTAINELSNATSEMQKYKCHISRKWARELDEFGEKALPKTHLYLSSANFSIKQPLFFSLGGFDERLNDAEDYELAIRAHESNIPVFYRSEAHAWHDENYTIASYIMRRKGYLQAHQTLRKIKPTIYKKLYFQKKGGIKKAIFWLFSCRLWLTIIDHFNVLRVLPKVLRFKIYDIVITSHVIYYPK